MTTARDKFVAWLDRAAGKRARSMPGTLGLEAAFRAGWTAALRCERRKRRFIDRLLEKIRGPCPLCEERDRIDAKLDRLSRSHAHK